MADQPGPGHPAATTEIRQLAPASSAPRRGSAYAQLSRQVKEAGLLERRPGYYCWKIAVTIGLLAAGWAAFVVVGNSWWQLAVAVFLAVVFTQIGFLGHDAGHRQVFGTRRASYVAGILLGNLGIGLSYGRRLPHRGVPGALTGQGRCVHDRAARPVRPVPGLLVRPQSQGHAHPGRCRPQ